VVIVFFISFTWGGNISSGWTRVAMENEAIENGAAYYNSTNKVFTWKTSE